MSRRGTEKNVVFVYLFIFILLVYLFFKFGLRLFVDVAFFIKQGGKQNYASPATKENRVAIITEPILDNVPEATNEATLVITGRSGQENRVQFFQNDEKISEVETDFDGNFRYEVLLELGQNQIYVVSYDSYSKKKMQSKNYDVVYLNKPPLLEISSISDQQKFYNSDVTIDGKTQAEVFIRINSLPIITRADGSFSYPLRLKKGENKVKVEATDLAGNATLKEFTLYFVE